MEASDSSEALIADIKRRFVKGFLDLVVLKLIQDEPMWGYKILKKTKDAFQIKLRHGALYPLLSALEANGFIRGKKELRKGRIRKVYQITSEGTQLLKTYKDFFEQQL